MTAGAFIYPWSVSGAVRLSSAGRGRTTVGGRAGGDPQSEARTRRAATETVEERRGRSGAREKATNEDLGVERRRWQLRGSASSACFGDGAMGEPTSNDFAAMAEQ